MNKYLVDVISAVARVDSDYFKARGTRPNETQYDQHIEQSFSAELFHQFRTIMEETVNVSYYNNLVLHFDITKLSVDSRPDLVLHESQENRNNQQMFIEVKTNPRANLTNDFNKLIMATEEYLNFKNSVIVVVNRPFSETHNLILNHNNFRNIHQNQKDRIFIINVFDNDGDIEYDMYNIKYLPRNNR